MKCPNCGEGIHFQSQKDILFERICATESTIGDGVHLHCGTCPECHKELIICQWGPTHIAGETLRDQWLEIMGVVDERILWPLAGRRTIDLDGVPKALADAYREACKVHPVSPMASAALARRCLQQLLRDFAKVNPGNLADEIQQVLDAGTLPTTIHENVDAIRNFGNFAAHPMKDKAGAIIDVEPEEAEWTLEILEELLEHYIVRPEKTKGRLAALNSKLASAGKPKARS